MKKHIAIIEDNFEKMMMAAWGVDEYSIYESIHDLPVEDYEKEETLLEDFEKLEWSDDLEAKILKILGEEIGVSDEELAEPTIKERFETTQWNINRWWDCEARLDLMKRLYAE